MNINELITEINGITNRPDLVALTLAAVRSSTLKIHSADFFYKDLVEVRVNFSSSTYIQEINLTSTFPYWRALHYYRQLLNNLDGTVSGGAFFEVLSPKDTLDAYGIEKSNVIYQAGTQLNIKAAVASNAGTVGYYRYPDTTVENYDSWVAREFPWVIIYDAATKVLKSVRYDEQANGTAKFAAELLQEMIAANIVVEGS